MSRGQINETAFDRFGTSSWRLCLFISFALSPCRCTLLAVGFCFIAFNSSNSSDQMVRRLSKPRVEQVRDVFLLAYYATSSCFEVRTAKLSRNFRWGWSRGARGIRTIFQSSVINGKMVAMGKLGLASRIRDFIWLSRQPAYGRPRHSHLVVLLIDYLGGSSRF
jgi:hypothetical protein